jgi:curved DNA-binding protein CbpA
MSSPPADAELSSIDAILLWDAQLDELDYYTLLGVTDQASVLDYEQAYHRFALQFHPDCHPNDEAIVRDALTRIFQRGVEARRVLSDPELHARYRALHQRGIRRFLDDSPVVPLDLEEELPKLHEICRSAGAKLEAMAAARALSRHELDEVRRRLASALAYDGDTNPDVERCLSAVERALSASDGRTPTPRSV